MKNKLMKNKRATNFFFLMTFLVSSAALFSNGCGTWIGNPKQPDTVVPPPAEISINIVGGSTPLSLVNSIAVTVIGKDGNSSGVITLTTAYAALKEIKLKKSAADDGSESEFKGPFVIDFIANTMTPKSNLLSSSIAEFTSITMKLDKIEDDGCATLGSFAQLCKRSIYLEGSYLPTSGTVKNFTMSFEFDEEFSLPTAAAGKAMKIATGKQNIVVIRFGLDKWFKFNSTSNENKVDFSDITDPNITLTEDANGVFSSLKEAIKKNIQGSTQYGVDDDNDGQLEKTEVDAGSEEN